MRWARSAREDFYSGLYATDQHALYSAGSEGLTAVDLETGRTRWTTRVPYFAPFEPFTVVKNRIFVFTVSGDAMSARTSMFDARTGRRLGEADTRGPLAVLQGRMFFQNDWFPLDSPDDVFVNVYDLRTGKPLERRTYTVKNRVTGNYTSSEIAMDSGAIYVSGGGNLACFPARQRGGVAKPNFIQLPRGEVAWRAGPRRGVFVLEWRGSVWLVRARRDAPCAPVNLRREGLRLGPGRVARVTFAGRGVCVGLRNGLFYAADVRSNQVLRKFRLPTPAYGPSRVVGDKLIVQAGAELLAFALPD